MLYKSRKQCFLFGFFVFFAYKQYSIVTGYEITIKTRRVNDPYDTMMLDIVKGSIVYDVSEVFGINITDSLWTGYSNNSLASAWATQSKAINRQITTFNSDIEKLG